MPIWETVEQSFLLSYFYNKTFTLSTNISSYSYEPAAQDPRTTEDCLFLDVVVPKKVFDSTKKKRPSRLGQGLAPVLVWIYGGGYVAGEKSSSDPTGLIQRSMLSGGGIVYVALNYRVS